MPNGRNKPCECGSGLKTKWCHGDGAKKALSLHVSRLVFLAEVAETKVKKGLMESQDRDDFIQGTVVPDFLKVIGGTTFHNYLEMAVFNKYEELNN